MLQEAERFLINVLGSEEGKEKKIMLTFTKRSFIEDKKTLNLTHYTFLNGYQMPYIVKQAPSSTKM